jgi:diadenosine tetraphosphatase ApaH/serine/threonine PP2A family protein phosphatase
VGVREDRIGFVAEEFDGADGSRLAGTFCAHWESRDHADWGQGPEGVSAEEAIAWAREHATQVSVLLYDDSTIYSAGEVPYEELPPWPEEGMVLKPRPIGAPRDGSVQEIPWPVSSEIERAGRPDRDALARLEALIAAHPLVANVRSRRKRRRLLVEVDYTAPRADVAVTAVHDLVSDALAQVLPHARPGTTGWES